MQQKVEVKFLGNDKFEVSPGSCSNKAYIDKPAQDYESCGPNPLEAFLASLGSCVGVFAKSYLKRQQIEFKELNMEVSAGFVSQAPMHLANIKVQVKTDAELGDKKEIFMRALHACPVHNTIVNTKDIEIIA